METAIAVIDKTGRGHVLCEMLLKYHSNIKVYYIPGTGGFFHPRIITVPEIEITDFVSIEKLLCDKKIETVVVSHIEALAAGMTDFLRKRSFIVFGTTHDAVRLETSKWFCKDICSSVSISTPNARLITSEEQLRLAVSRYNNQNYMVKADWLAQHGNGAFKMSPGDNITLALDKISQIMTQNPDKPFRFLIEDFQVGTDYSAHYFLNSNSIITLPSAMDYKKSHDNDSGLNCDGMGTLSPHPLETEELNQRIQTTILKPFLYELSRRKINYSGPIYLGLRIDKTGKPHLLEVNTRLGDSEAQVILPRLREDLFKLITFLSKDYVVDEPITIDPEICMCISLVTGCPFTERCASHDSNKYWPLQEIGSDQDILFFPDLLASKTQVFWAGVQQREKKKISTLVGRVAHITGFGVSYKEAREQVYNSLDSVVFKGIRWREDIGLFNE